MSVPLQSDWRDGGTRVELFNPVNRGGWLYGTTTFPRQLNDIRFGIFSSSEENKTNSVKSKHLVM